VYCRVIACDFDGTTATNGHPAPELSAALAAARIQGIVTLLVTGRVLEEVKRLSETAPFDAIVAENGAVVYLGARGRTIELGKPPPESFIRELRAEEIPFHTGAVILGTQEEHASQLLNLIRRFELDRQLIFNREALMLLPSGINKATGIRSALDTMGRSEHNMVAFGDAENDIPMLVSAAVGVAAQDSVSSVLALADDRVPQPGGTGVASYICSMLDRGGILPTPARQTINLGISSDGTSALIPTSGVNVVVSGDPRSGKSWIAALITEQLAEQGYRVCVIDPEGDYVQLGQRPGIVMLGDDLILPPPHVAARMMAGQPLSAIFSLSSLSPGEQANYVEGLLASLEETRRVTGIPHWIVIDEAHYFFLPSSSCNKRLESGTGSFCLVTYRPSLLAPEVYRNIGAYVIARTGIRKERCFVTRILQAHGAKESVLDGIQWPCAGLMMKGAFASPWQVFLPSERGTPHAHHAPKVAATRFTEDKAFTFVHVGASVTVHSIVEFYQAIQMVPLASLRHHLNAGDFSRWVGDVIGDPQLAKGLRKLERTTLRDAPPERAEILAHIRDCYLIPEE